MRFNNRMRNAETHAHAILLRGKERLEQPLQPVRSYTRPRIADRDECLRV